VGTELPGISVVIPTYERREECKRAVASALEQQPSPLEVLVCDDGSTDGTEAELNAWAREEPRLRYLRLRSNQGSPAPARDLGIQSARGEWIALLDSDDQWLPGKLAAQAEHIAGGRYEVIASDAKRRADGAYFGLSSPKEPGPAEFLIHNPIITSTAIARRTRILSAGGFTRSALGVAITGVDDYALWLAIAYAGGRFLVIPEQFAVYTESRPGSVSGAVFQQQAQVAAVRWGLWLRRPRDRAVLRSALRGTLDAARWGFRRAGGRGVPRT
jgi:glycosyltransferase involved in cell wall biosynthesis